MCHDLRESSSLCIYACVLVATSSTFISLWEKLIGCMSVMFSWRFAAGSLFLLWLCFENGIICYVFFHFYFVLLGNKGMSKIRFDECIMTILNHFINCISFFRQMARMDNFTNVWVDIYVFNFVLNREWCVLNAKRNQKWLTISHSQLGILTDYKFKLLK